MTKAELIARYGVEWYEEHKAKTYKRFIDRYNNYDEFREIYKDKKKEQQKERYNNNVEYAMNNRLSHTRKYCRAGEFERIVNYELAKADDFKGWDIHHRLELTLNGEYAHDPEELKRMNMYYDRPYFELIFLTRADHNKLHKCAKEVK